MSSKQGYQPVVLTEGVLPEVDGHKVAYTIGGNPSGPPVLFLHGGPGGGTSLQDMTFFDPSFYRVVLMDQRGAGRSEPSSCVEANTTWHLVSDIERLREVLGIDRWFAVFGGSWGSTLSLAYAVTHPTRITHAVVLRGIFTLRRSELQFFYQEGANHIFPDAWKAYRDAIPEAERGDYIAAYHRRLFSEDAETRSAAAKAWTTWEYSTCRLVPDPELIKRGSDEQFADRFARIESHYFVNGGFFEKDSNGGDEWLLERAGEVLPSQPFKVFIVHGRYDVVCPIRSAFDLKERVPNATLVVTLAGHSAKEPETFETLVGWMNELRDQYRALVGTDLACCPQSS